MTDFIERSIYFEFELEGLNVLCLTVGETKNDVLNIDWIELFTPKTPELFAHVAAVDYYRQEGIKKATNSNALGYFDEDDYYTFSHLNFGPSGTITGIRFLYSQGQNNQNLQLHLKLDGPSGPIIRRWNPPNTGGWSNYQEVEISIDIDEFDGIHDLTFYGTNGSGVMNLIWFELVGSLKSTITLPKMITHIPATQYTQKVGTKTKDSVIVSLDNNDRLTYSYINFGQSGTVKSVWIRYAKGNIGGVLEFRVDGPSGTIIGQFAPASTGGWNEFRDIMIPFSADVFGLHDLILIGKNTNSILRLEWLVLDTGTSATNPYCACNRNVCRKFTIQ